MSNYITIAAANKMTKAQLIEALMAAQAALAANQEILVAASDLTEELELTQQKLKAAQAVNEKLLAQPAKQLSPARAAYLASANARRAASQAATEAYRAKCAAARAQAMATGKAVLV